MRTVRSVISTFLSRHPFGFRPIPRSPRGVPDFEATLALPTPSMGGNRYTQLQCLESFSNICLILVNSTNFLFAGRSKDERPSRI